MTTENQAPEGGELTSGAERDAFLREFTGGSSEYRAWAWQGWQARAALAAQPGVAPTRKPLSEWDVSVLIAENPRDRDLVRAVERAHGITAPKEPTNER